MDPLHRRSHTLLVIQVCASVCLSVASIDFISVGVVPTQEFSPNGLQSWRKVCRIVNRVDVNTITSVCMRKRHTLIILIRSESSSLCFHWVVDMAHCLALHESSRQRNFLRIWPFRASLSIWSWRQIYLLIQFCICQCWNGSVCRSFLDVENFLSHFLLSFVIIKAVQTSVHFIGCKYLNETAF